MKTKFLYGLMAALAAPFAYSQTFTINEIDSDNPSTDTLEFIEIYDGGVGNSSLDGLVLVLYNGSSDQSYASYDLDTFTTNAEGFFVIGSVSGADTGFAGASNQLQNGADAVALYTGDATAFPSGTAATNANVVDAIVYGTNDGDDAGLLAIFGGEQQDEDAEGDKDNDSIQRNPDGGTEFIVDAPTPGSTNVLDPLITLELDPSVVSEGDGIEAITATVVLPDIVSGDLTLSVAIDDGTELAGPTSVTILDGEDFVEFNLDAVDDLIVDGPQSVEITVSAAGYRPGIATATVGDDDLELPQIVINEMQVKGDGINPEFVELYNADSTPIDIAGWSVKVFASDSGRTDFGDEDGSFTIPSGTPVMLAAGGFYLAGNADFEALYGFTPDLQVEPDFSNFDITMILFDDADNAVYTVFSTDGDTDNQPNNAGAVAVPDLTIGPDAGSPAGYILDSDGGSSASTFLFSEFPDSLATPGTTNSSLLSRLQIVSDVVLFDETAGVGAATATITRINDTSGPLTVSVSSSDASEIVFQTATVAFADGEDEQTVLLDVLDDSDMDGLQSVTLTASATGFISGTEEVSVLDDDTPIAELVINEMIIDTAGTDTEFLEIYNAGAVDVDLAGYSVEKWESDSGQAPAQDNTGSIFIPAESPVIIAAGGYYLIASAAFETAYPTVTVDFQIANNSFENSSATYVLRDANSQVVHTVFATDGGAGDAANINGTLITPDAVGNDVAFALLPDGDSSNVVAISNAVPSLEATPRASNGVATAYEVTISDCSASGGQFVINFTATGSSDVYVSSDLINWVGATNGAGVASGTYTDTAPPAGKAFYLIQEAGTTAP